MNFLDLDEINFMLHDPKPFEDIPSLLCCGYTFHPELEKWFRLVKDTNGWYLIGLADEG